MSIHFDLSEDTRYLAGLEQGVAQGEERGVMKGVALTTKIIKHYLRGETAETIAHILAIEAAKVNAVIAEYEAE